MQPLWSTATIEILTVRNEIQLEFELKYSTPKIHNKTLPPRRIITITNVYHVLYISVPVHTHQIDCSRWGRGLIMYFRSAILVFKFQLDLISHCVWYAHQCVLSPSKALTKQRVHDVEG